MAKTCLDSQIYLHTGLCLIKHKVSFIVFDFAVMPHKLHPKFVIALSNMAWFAPSTAPVLQKLLINVYALKYKKRVYHSLNYYKSYGRPENFFLKM